MSEISVQHLPSAAESPALAEQRQDGMPPPVGETERRVTAPRLSKEVEDFLLSLYHYVYDRDVGQIKRLYEKDFNDVTEALYPMSRWPPLKTVHDFYTASNRYHDLIMTLYTELYFRHVFSNCGPTVTPGDREESFASYSLLLEYFITDECQRERGHDGLKLPDQWLWDILDEYVYQYQESQRWRLKTVKAAVENPESLKEEMKPDVWSTKHVIVNLRSLVERSGIKELMKQIEIDPRSCPEELGVPHSLGYFAMISLLRLHVLLGDYRAALASVSGLDLTGRGLYHKVPACHISLFYNLGFAYMMLRRYQDAIKHFSNILMFINRNRSYISSQSYQKGTMTKTVDKMYHLMMLCTCLSPGRLQSAFNDSTTQLIKEKYPEKYFKLQGDDDDAYRDTFLKACPKFVDPAIPSLNNPLKLSDLQSDDAQARQLSAFLRDVRFQRMVSNVRSFAKLYNNIQLQKLGSLMDIKERNSVEIVRSELLCVKHKGRQIVQTGGTDFLRGGCVQTLSDVDFYVDNDVVHVKSVKSQPTYVDWFLKQMQKTQDLIHELGESNRR